jgi:uncharacterized membrane protein
MVGFIAGCGDAPPIEIRNEHPKAFGRQAIRQERDVLVDSPPFLEHDDAGCFLLLRRQSQVSGTRLSVGPCERHCLTHNSSGLARGTARTFAQMLEERPEKKASDQYSEIRVHSQTPSDEPRWHASVAVIVAMLLYATLPEKLVLGPVWILPLLVLVVLVPLSVFSPTRHAETDWQRAASIFLIAVLNFFNVASVVLLVYYLLFSKNHADLAGQEILRHGTQIWLTNILVFALWYWELDCGGPEPRAHAEAATEFRAADFLFPQMMLDPARIACVEEGWKPLFLDYLYLAFTDATAFSPTDVMPITRLAKMLMLVEATISLVTIAIILARAINIIS